MATIQQVPYEIFHCLRNLGGHSSEKEILLTFPVVAVEDLSFLHQLYCFPSNLHI